MNRRLGLDDKTARRPSLDDDFQFKAVKESAGADFGGKEITCQCCAVRDDVRTNRARWHEHIPKYFGFIRVV